MSLDFFRNLTRVFGILTIGVLFGVIAFAALLEVKDLDLWLHLKMGDVITSTGHIPDKDILSFSIAGKPWVNHEWLFQTVVYSVYSMFHINGLLFMQSFLVLLSFALLLFWTYRSDRHLVIIPLLFYVLQIYQTRFTVRPDIFSVVYFILFLMLLLTSMEKRWVLPAFFVLQVLWTNMHGFFLAGPVLVFIFLLAEVLRRFAPCPAGWKVEGRLTDTGFKHLAWVLFIVLAATLINPLGWQGAVYPWRVMLDLSGESRVFFKYITELQPAFAWGSFFDFAQALPLKILIMVSTISFIFNIRRLNLGLFLVWLGIVFLGVGALRNMLYLAVVSYVATLVNLKDIDLKLFVPARFLHESFELVTGWLAKIVLAVLIINYATEMLERGYYDFSRYERKNEYLGVAQRMFPEQAVDFLIKNKISGFVFNDFNTGAYVVGKAYPQLKVFIDGRTEVYGPLFFKNYRKMWDEGDGEMFHRLVRQYDFKVIMLGAAYSRPSEKMLDLVVKDKMWVLVYFDHDGLIFLKDVPENKGIIERFAIDFKTWAPVVSDTRKMGSAKAFPYREVNRATMLKDMGYPDQALSQADAALLVQPACLDALRLKAQIYEDKKDYSKMFEYYRAALLQSPNDAKLRRGFALAYVGLGLYADALKQAERLEGVDGDLGVFYVRAKVFAKKKQYKEAYDILIRQIFPHKRGASEIAAVADQLAEDGAFVWAAKAYALAYRKDTNAKETLEKFKEAELKAQGAVNN